MRIISKQTLVKFYERYPDSKKPLINWHNIAKKSTFSNINQVKQAFNKVSILSENRIVFYICWVGTHDEYDKIDANKIWDY